MSRRRRRPRSQNPGLQLVQILSLGLVLVMILLFRDQIAGGAGDFFSGFGSEDVQLPEESIDAGMGGDDTADLGRNKQPTTSD